MVYKSKKACKPICKRTIVPTVCSWTLFIFMFSESKVSIPLHLCKRLTIHLLTITAFVNKYINRQCFYAGIVNICRNRQYSGCVSPPPSPNRFLRWNEHFLTKRDKKSVPTAFEFGWHALVSIVWRITRPQYPHTPNSPPSENHKYARTECRHTNRLSNRPS